MTVLEDLVQLVEQDPDNTIVRSMLVDELMDVKDMTRSEAEQKATICAAMGSAVSRIKLATSLLMTGTASRRHLVGKMYRLCRVQAKARPTVFVTAGDYLFVTPNQSRWVDADYWGQCIITAGASWILANWSARLEELKELRRARQARPKSR